MAAKTVPYSQVRDAVLRRRGIVPGNETAAQQADAADYITSAYKYCLESYQWAEAIVTTTVTCTNGLVTWADVEDASWWEFYSEDPRPYDAQGTTEAYLIEVRRSGNDGLWLKTELETVFVRYIAAAETQVADTDWSLDSDYAIAANIDLTGDGNWRGNLEDWPILTNLDISGIYAYGGGQYYSTTNDIWTGGNVPPGAGWDQITALSYLAGKIYLSEGRYYRCVTAYDGSPPIPADNASFEILPLGTSMLAILAEATQWIALADWFDTIQERNQAANLRKQGEDALNKLFTRSAAS